MLENNKNSKVTSKDKFEINEGTTKKDTTKIDKLKEVIIKKDNK